MTRRELVPATANLFTLWFCVLTLPENKSRSTAPYFYTAVFSDKHAFFVWVTQKYLFKVALK